MFCFDVGVAYFLHVTEIRGPTHKQSGESRSAVLSSCYSIPEQQWLPLCTVLLFIGRILIESAANPASYRTCTVFAFLLCLNYRVLLFRFLLLSSTGTSHIVTKTARSDMSCPTLTCCAEPSSYSFQQVLCVLCVNSLR